MPISVQYIDSLVYINAPSYQEAKISKPTDSSLVQDVYITIHLVDGTSRRENIGSRTGSYEQVSSSRWLITWPVFYDYYSVRSTIDNPIDYIEIPYNNEGIPFPVVNNLTVSSDSVFISDYDNVDFTQLFETSTPPDSYDTQHNILAYTNLTPNTQYTLIVEYSGYSSRNLYQFTTGASQDGVKIYVKIDSGYTQGVLYIKQNNGYVQAQSIDKLR